MGIFDIFSSKPSENAAQQRIQGLQAGQTAANSAINTGLQGLQTGYGQAQNLYGPLQSLYQGISSDVSGRYAPLEQKSTQRASAYDDASGVNGPEGLARAKALFTATPGYTEGLGTGLDSLDRRAAARGQLGGGNTSADTLKYATDYANQGYGNYMSGLRPFVGQDISTANDATAAQMGAAGGQAGVAGQQAGLYTGLANKLYEGNVAKGGIGFQTAQGVGNANADAAMAPYQQSQNFWSTLLGAGNLATSVPWKKVGSTVQGWGQ